MVAPFSVFRLVVDHIIDDLDLADGEIPLEVRQVIQGVPEAELDRSEDWTGAPSPAGDW